MVFIVINDDDGKAWLWEVQRAEIEANVFKEKRSRKQKRFAHIHRFITKQERSTESYLFREPVEP